LVFAHLAVFWWFFFQLSSDTLGVFSMLGLTMMAAVVVVDVRDTPFRRTTRHPRRCHRHRRSFHFSVIPGDLSSRG